MAERAPDAVRYTAFLSYSHRDSAAAGKLHRRLESYRLPKRLAGLETARGRVPERLCPIFRDRDELPAATDLSLTVREALAESGSLIILCSPNAAGSPWVAQEIETFQTLHPDRPVLAAILEGEPPDCFPLPLRARDGQGMIHEPLATDLREDGDGGRLGLLKLVAGITGVGLDALVQRDASRRVRRVMAVTTTALVAMLMMAGLTLLALKARGEAERQRAESEDLVQFMLTDLHARLEDVGRLDVMRAVNERALVHYDLQINRGDKSIGTALQRARVLHGLGEEDILRGDYAAALRRFADANRITSAALREAPDDLDRIFAQGQSDYWFGRVHELRGEWPAASRFYRAYADAAARLIAAAPSNPDYMMERAYAATNLGVASLRGLGDPAGAEAQFRASIRWFEAARRARPDDETSRLELANATGYLADSYWDRRLWRQSLAARRRQVALLEPLHRAEPGRTDIFYRFALGQNGLARTLGAVGDRDSSLALLGQTLGSARRLADLDPENGEWRTFKAFVECELLLGPGPPPGMSRASLAREFRDGMKWMRTKGISGLERFQPCEKSAQGD